MRTSPQGNDRASRPPPLDVEVVGVQPRSGNFVRLTLAGDAVAGMSWPGAASHLKLLPPPIPADVASDAPARPISRTYTPRAIDQSRGELTLDVLLHGDGPAATWVRSAEIGERARVSVPRSSWSPRRDADWLVLAGDDSAIPAIATILEAGTPRRTTVFIETTSAADDRPDIPMPDAISWVNARTDAPGQALREAIASCPGQLGSGLVWVACEAVAVRQIRRFLIDERSFATDAIVTRGYWRQGESNHPDHDFGEDA